MAAPLFFHMIPFRLAGQTCLKQYDTILTMQQTSAMIADETPTVPKIPKNISTAHPFLLRLNKPQKSGNLIVVFGFKAEFIVASAISVVKSIQ